MSLLPIPSRLPARKHLIAGAVSFAGLGLMIMAVLTASGLASPFSSSDPDSIRTEAVLIEGPTTTVAPTTTTAVSSPSANPAVLPVPAAPTSRPTATTAPRPGPTTTSTTLIPPTTVPPPPTLLPPLGGLGFG
jgi:hypothetical protein